MTTPKPSLRHLKASKLAIRDTQEMQRIDANYLESLCAAPAGPSAPIPYDFGDELYDFWYALGFLIAGDHALGERELLDLIAHLKEVPDEWRTVIYLGSPELVDRVPLYVSRNAEGLFEPSQTLGESLAHRTELRRAARSSARGVCNQISVDQLAGSDLAISINEHRIKTPLELQWWASDVDDDYAGTLLFTESTCRLGSLRAVVRELATRRSMCVIADACSTIVI